MPEDSIPVGQLPGEWRARSAEHPEVPSSDPIAECPTGAPPPSILYDVRENVGLRFGAPVAIYDVHGDLHVYPTEPLEADDALLHAFERSAGSRIRFGNRTRRVHLHGNTVDEIKAGRRHNEAIGILIHRADGGRTRVFGDEGADPP